MLLLLSILQFMCVSNVCDITFVWAFPGEIQGEV